MGGRGPAFDRPPSNIYDSAIAGLVKLLYGVLQCIYHIAILEKNLANSLSKALEKKVNELNSFIKPARSNLDIYIRLKPYQSNHELVGKALC